MTTLCLMALVMLSGSPWEAQAEERHLNAATAAARPKLARVGVFANPETATIYLDGRVVGEGKFVGQVSEGPHTLRFELDGYNTVEEQLVLSADDGPGYLVVHLRPTSQPVLKQEGRRGGFVDSFDEEIAAWSLTGAGGVMLVGGIVMLALDGQPACSGPAARCPKVFETTGGGVTLAALGTVALTSGVMLFLWDELAGREPLAPEPAWQLGLAPLGDEQTEGGAVWVQGTW